MKEEIKYNIKITIKAICLYEDLTGKPFSLCFEDTENIIPLIYCILYAHPENNITVTYQEILPLLSNEKILEPIAVGIKKEIDIIKQFDSHRDTSTNETYKISAIGKGSEKREQGIVYMKDIVPILVADCGLDINYIMNEMSYTDIDSFIHYRELKKQDELETQRLWAFFGILPQVDSKKIKKPDDLIKFPWEKTSNTNTKFDEEIDEVTKQLKSLGIIKEES